MTTNRFNRFVLWLTAALLSASLMAQTSTLTYQGQLRENGQPFTGTANLEFRLFDQLIGGSEVAAPQTRLNWPVEDGLFQVGLDFGAGVFNGSDLFLEVEVNGAPLNPRQPVTATPYALLAAATADGAVGGSAIDPTQVQRRVDGSCPAGQSIREINENGSVTCEVDDTGTLGWSLTGNAGTTAGTNFLGTTDDRALEFKVNGARGLRLEPDSASPRLIGGYSGNSVDAGVHGATISGGGRNGEINRVTGDYGTVGGGIRNTASGFVNTVSGGFGNTTSGSLSIVGGGASNTASDSYSTVGGGISNTASGSYSTVSGGSGNCAGGEYSWSGGQSAKVRPGTGSGAAGFGCADAPLSGDANGDEGTFIWADSEFADFVSTGPDQFLIRAWGGVGINTNAPTSNLHLGGLLTSEDVLDGIRLENTLNRSWDIHLSSAYLRFNYDPGDGNSTNVAYVNNVDGSWNQLSDRRLKNDIRPLGSVLEQVAAIEVVDYRFKHSAPDGARHIGLIAQNVAEYFPALASESDGNGYLAVNYAGFSVIALKAIQEQQAIIAGLHSKVSNLEIRADQVEQIASRNAELEARLTALEALLMNGHGLAEQGR